MLNIDFLKSGSKGNCIIIDEIIMLDCGVAYELIKDRLPKVKVIFISHSHKDHLLPSTIKKIAYEYPNIKFIVGYTLAEKLIECNVSRKNIFALQLEKWYDIGIAKIKLDYLIHDVPNCAIHIEYKNNKLIYATDTSEINHIVAKDYDYYLIEANYETDEELLEIIKKDKEKNNGFSYRERVLKTHLSQLKAINWLDKNKNENSVYYFIHQHIEKGE